MDLTILVNLSQICQSENRRTGLTILTNFSKICQSEIRSVDLTSLLFLPILLLHTFLDIP